VHKIITGAVHQAEPSTKAWPACLQQSKLCTETVLQAVFDQRHAGPHSGLLTFAYPAACHVTHSAQCRLYTIAKPCPVRLLQSGTGRMPWEERSAVSADFLDSC
jgi:hypothetical protein